ncbi:MAG: AAA family ATPase, partial [Planctomycetes bacterium]|nr:AAA family ATPase [Planctomycetota bacterium]
MSLVAHKYMPEEMPVEELRATFAAREHTLDYLLKSLADQCDSKTLTSYLITGPRGAGKTTIVLMLCLRIAEDERLAAAWLPVRFPEELPGVTSLRDLLAEALHVMAEDGVADAAELHKKVAAEMDDEQSLELAVGGLRQIAERQGRRLVLFVENLDLVFDRGLDERTQQTLRRLLMDSPFMMIVGTAVHAIQDLAAYDQALFNYFCPVPLERLDGAQVRQILFQRAEFDGNEKFREQYQRHQARIKTISRLTGGNPRLVLMLYEALAHGNLASTVETLRALVDELTPLLKHVLEHQFSDQQSKILDALMRCGATATPTEIAEAARLRLNTVTAQLSRLKEMQIVELRGGGKGRPAYYTVPDQLFSTWYQMRYLRRHRRRIELFVDVLRLWFEEEERLEMMRQLAEKACHTIGKTASEAATATEYLAASLAQTTHHPQAREMAVRTWLEIGNLAEAAFALAEDADINAADRQGYEAAAFTGLGRWSRDHDDPDTEIEALRMALDRDPDNLILHVDLGFALTVSGQYDTARQSFDRVANDPACDVWLRAWASYGRSFTRRDQDDTDGEIGDYTAVVELEGAPADLVAYA